MDDYLPSDHSEGILMGESALKVWREYRGRTVAEVADSAGLSPEALIALEEREAPLDLQTRDNLARALDVPASWIEREEHE
jgi:transcriptional regulator with XRE-family HTH domain